MFVVARLYLDINAKRQEKRQRKASTRRKGLRRPVPVLAFHQSEREACRGVLLAPRRIPGAAAPPAHGTTASSCRTALGKSVKREVPQRGTLEKRLVWAVGV